MSSWFSRTDIGNFQPCATPSRVADSGLPAMCFGYLLDNSQSKSSAVLPGRVASLKHIRPFVSGKPWPIIFHIEPIGKIADSYCHACAAVFHGIREQVPNQLFEKVAVGLDRTGGVNV
ncbi:MAG: hypothetical protein J07HX5_01554 [halophilic archaeon J07HX5]|nr:MAG: hypothetical protein J07HX5_01554 [halophilic archaeon J07HX5]